MALSYSMFAVRLRSFTLRNFIEECRRRSSIRRSTLRSFTLRNFIEDSKSIEDVSVSSELRSFTLRNFIEEWPWAPRSPAASIAKLYASQLH